MNRSASLVACLAVAAACGGGGSKAAREPEPPADPDPLGDYVEPAEEEPEEPPPPPPPQEWFAKVSLAPVKGSKMRSAVIRFEQTEGGGVRAISEAPLQGLKAGQYHLVVHEGSACGKNAKSAGPAWSEAVAITLEVVKGAPAILDQEDLELMLDGELSIVGRALVVHADKKGRPDKALACGVIESAEGAAGADEEEDLDDE